MGRMVRPHPMVEALCRMLHRCRVNLETSRHQTTAIVDLVWLQPAVDEPHIACFPGDLMVRFGPMNRVRLGSEDDLAHLEFGIRLTLQGRDQVLAQVDARLAVEILSAHELTGSGFGLWSR